MSMKQNLVLGMALATMMCGSAYAATPQNTSYDFFVNVPNITQDWHKPAYDDGVNVPKVTMTEAVRGGYDENNVPARNITEEELEELMRGNGDDGSDAGDGDGK